MAEQPNHENATFDLDRALSSIVSLRSRIPEDALTAPILGTEREGHGVLIRDNGLVLTIGYLITEAESVWLVDASGAAAPGYVVGYDQETGFGLVQALQPLNVSAMAMGSSEALAVGDSVVVAGSGGRSQAINARVIAKQEFAGYWEYLLDEAIFTTPPHENWGGTALIGSDGTLRGIGSLFIQQAASDEQPGGNMIVPIDLLKPILEELLMYGRINKPPRPWLGMITTEIGDNLVVAGVIDGGPAESADVRVGDLVLEVAGAPISGLAAMFRRIWSLGRAGVQVSLTLYRDGRNVDVQIQSVDRYACLKSPHLH